MLVLWSGKIPEYFFVAHECRIQRVLRVLVVVNRTGVLFGHYFRMVSVGGWSCLLVLLFVKICARRPKMAHDVGVSLMFLLHMGGCYGIERR